MGARKPAGPPGSPSRYRLLLSGPGAVSSTAASVLARLPSAMSNLVLVTAVASATGSFAQAGWAAAAFVAGVAVSGPVRGRLVDRRGASLVLATVGLVTAAVWLILFWVLEAGAPMGAVVACCLAAGATYPPVTPVMRTMWSRTVSDPDLKVAAISLESVIVEVSYIGGPALAALGVVVLGAVPSVLLVAGLSGGGCAWLALTRRVRALGPQDATVRHLMGPVRERSVRRMLAVGFFAGAGVSAVEVAVLASTAARGRPSLGGVVIACLSVGSVVGGLVYGARTTSQLGLHRLRVLLVAVGIGFGCSALTTDVLVLAVLVTATGLVFAPMTSELYAAFERASPPHLLTETFTWQASATQAGAVATVALAGGLAEGGQPGGGFVVAMLTCLVAAGLTSAVPLSPVLSRVPPGTP